MGCDFFCHRVIILSERGKTMTLEETIKRQHNGSVYHCNSEELVRVQNEAQEMLYDYNMTRPSEKERRQELLKKMFAEFGEDNYIEPPLHSNWGGNNVHFGSHVYANYNLTLVDDTHIYIEDNVLFGPNVTVCTAAHPIDPTLRLKPYEYNKPITIKKNAWIGGNVIILPGVTIGENTIIGAGSVVTKDIPANVIAVGNPCRILRPITEDDAKYYDHGKVIDYENLD